MRKIFCVSLALLASSSLAAQTAQPADAGAAAPAAAPAPAKPVAAKPICHTYTDTGSRLSSHRECHTKAEWDRIAADAKDDFMRNNRANPGLPSGG